MAAVRRVLHDDGVAFVELGDGYSGSGMTGGKNSKEGSAGRANRMFHGNRQDTIAGIPAKSLILVPERFRLAMVADGWIVRSVIRWAKRAPMPESVKDRPTSAVSEVVMLTKGARYFADMQAVAEQMAPESAGRYVYAFGGSKAEHLSVTDNRTVPIGKRMPTAGRNPRNYAVLDPDDWMPIPDYQLLSPEPSKRQHYASYGPKAITPLVKMATSEHGCCSRCGAAYERTTATGYDNPGNRTTNGPRSLANRDMTAGFPVRLEKRVETTGWKPRCQCTEIRCVDCGFVIESVHDNENSGTKRGVPVVRNDVPCSGRTASLLRSPLSGQGGAEATRPSPPAEDVRALREDVSVERANGEVLRQSLLNATHGAQSPELPGLVSRSQGIHPASPAGAPDVVETGIRDGASDCDGGTPGQDAPTLRGGSPQERDQGRQPDREPRTGLEQQRARQDEEAEIHGDLSLLRAHISDAGECPRCRGRLEQVPVKSQPCRVLDIFAGSGTTLVVAERLGLDATGIELNSGYTAMAMERVRLEGAPLFAGNGHDEAPTQLAMLEG